jgi:hypothetical protein
MKRTLTINDMASELAADENANFSYSGAMALAEWLEEMDEESGEDTEFDSVAIRCDFSECKSLEDWAKDYWGGSDQWKGMGIDLDGDEDDDEKDDLIRSFINDHGHLIEFAGGIIVSSF